MTAGHGGPALAVGAERLADGGDGGRRRDHGTQRVFVEVWQAHPAILRPDEGRAQGEQVS